MENQSDENMGSYNISFATCECGARNHSEIIIAAFFSKLL